MKRLLVFIFVFAACSPACSPATMRISAAVGRSICGALGCPCASSARVDGAGSAPVAIDVYPDGTVRPVSGGAR